jgi:hypothetical protein
VVIRGEKSISWTVARKRKKISCQKRRQEVSCDKLMKVMIHHGLIGFYDSMIFP